MSRRNRGRRAVTKLQAMKKRRSPRGGKRRYYQTALGPKILAFNFREHTGCQARNPSDFMRDSVRFAHNWHAPHAEGANFTQCCAGSDFCVWRHSAAEGAGCKIRSPKSEARKKSEFRNPICSSALGEQRLGTVRGNGIWPCLARIKRMTCPIQADQPSGFGFLSDFGPRISDF
jgi:hypothetical protein